MTTQLMLLGMKYQQQFNNWLGSFPIEWNESTQQYTYKRHLKKLKFYYFNIICLLYGVNIGSTFSILTIRWFKTHPEFGMEHWILFSLLLALMSFVVGIAIAIFLCGQEGVVCVNALIVHFRTLRIKYQSEKSRPKKYKSNIGGFVQRVKDLCHEENGSVDVLGIAIMYFVSYSLWFHYLTSLGAIFLDVNPMRHFGFELFGDKAMRKLKTRFYIALFSFVVLVFNTAQSTRLIQVIVILFVIPLQFYLKIMKILNGIYDSCKTIGDYERHHRQYVKLQLINNFIIPVAQVECFVLMYIARWMAIFCLFIVIKLNAYVPFIVTIGAGCGVIVVFLMGNLLFPYTTKMLDESISSISTWGCSLAPRQKYLRRKYASLRHLRFYAGLPGVRFFMFERSSTLDFFMSIVEPTIDLMISYPEDDIKEMFGKAG